MGQGAALQYGLDVPSWGEEDTSVAPAEQDRNHRPQRAAQHPDQLGLSRRRRCRERSRSQQQKKEEKGIAALYPEDNDYPKTQIKENVGC